MPRQAGCAPLHAPVQTRRLSCAGGLLSPSDEAFQASFANLYSAPGLQVPWYAVLGALRPASISRAPACHALLWREALMSAACTFHLGGSCLGSRACVMLLGAVAYLVRAGVTEHQRQQALGLSGDCTTA